MIQGELLYYDTRSVILQGELWYYDTKNVIEL